jgi:hypothetical protein
VVYLKEGMRYLDLEHEVGHLEQVRALGELVTKREVERPGRPPKEVRHIGGVLTARQDAVLEYHNRLKEYLRLRDRGAGSELLSEHAHGVRLSKSEYTKHVVRAGPQSTIFKWAREHFPDIPQLEERFRARGEKL